VIASQQSSCCEDCKHLSSPADNLGADMPDHLEQRDALQHFGRVLSELAQRAAARRAAAAKIATRRRWRPMHDLFARQVIRQRLACWLLPWNERLGGGSRLDDLCRSAVAFELLQHQLQLVDRSIKLLGRRPKLHAPQPGELRLQLLDHQHMSGVLGPKRCQHRLQRGDVVWKIVSL
jgi:hypothetical protein